MRNLFKQILAPVLIATSIYLLFYFQTLSPNILIGGSDPLKYFYPSRYYLYTSLLNGRFPFWTEKIFSGYPIYADPERTYLNPLNILTILFFGPFLSYKILHFIFYTIGALFLYLFLEKKSIYNPFSYISALLAFYYSFFTLYHQQHFSLTLILFLFPIFLFFVSDYTENLKVRNIIVLSFFTALTFYFGNLQSILLILIPCFLYAVIYIEKNDMYKILRHLFLYLLLTVALVLPQLLPTFELFANSTRINTESIFTQGSFMPMSMLNLVYPTLLGDGSNYKWNMVSDEFLIHETYIYVGIVAFVLGVLGFLKMEDIKLKKFVLCLICAFLLLSFWRYLPLLNDLPIPVLSLFRYWGRSVFFIIIALAICVATFFSSNKKIELKDIKRLFLIVLAIVGFLILIQVINFKNTDIWKPFYLIIHGAAELNTSFFIWLFLLTLTLILCSFSRSFKIKIIILILLLLDSFYFGKPIINGYLRNISEIYLPHQTYTTTSRQVGYDKSYMWNINLYSNNPGILGYSQFVPQNYLKHISKLGLKSNEILDDNVSQNALMSLGVDTLVTQNEQVSLSGKIIPYEKAFNILLTDGHVSFDVDLPKKTNITTLLRNYPGWHLKINTLPARFTNKSDDVYLTFDVPQGKSAIELDFIPTIFYQSLLLSICLILFVVAVYSPYGVKRILKNG